MNRSASSAQIQKNYSYWENERNIEILKEEIARLEKKLEAMKQELDQRIAAREGLHEDTIPGK